MTFLFLSSPKSLKEESPTSKKYSRSSPKPTRKPSRHFSSDTYSEFVKPSVKHFERRRVSAPLKVTIPNTPHSIIMASSPTKNAPSLDRDAFGPPAHKGAGLPMPGLSGTANGPVGNLLKGPVDASGKLKDAALMVGIKLDLEAEVHLTARIRGDILVGLY